MRAAVAISPKQAEIDHRNSAFWDELCGTSLAKTLGIHDMSAASLEKFDRYYMDLYPYLGRYLRLDDLRGRSVLEIGIGYGTVSQKLAGVAGRYQGLDIANGPVEMVNTRIAMNGLAGRAVRGSILDAPFPDASFDAVVTIGCLHHTGNIQRAIDEVHRVLRPGGAALVMIYNALSYRRWWQFPRATAGQYLQDYWGLGAVRDASEAERAAYDTGSEGAAPETEFTSMRRLRQICRGFSECHVAKENAEQERPFSRVRRSALLPTVGRFLGLDLYARLKK